MMSPAHAQSDRMITATTPHHRSSHLSGLLFSCEGCDLDAGVKGGQADDLGAGVARCAQHGNTGGVGGCLGADEGRGTMMIGGGSISREVVRSSMTSPIESS